MDEESDQQRHGDSHQVESLHEVKRVDARQQTAQGDRDKHLQREVEHLERRETHALHSLVDQSQRRRGFRREHADAIREENDCQSNKLCQHDRWNKHMGCGG